MPDMPDSLNKTMLAPSTVRIFGRVLPWLTVPDVEQKVALPKEYRARSPLSLALQGEDLKFAHVFAFSHEGRYTPLQVPALLLVHGPGDDVMDGSGTVDPARLGLAHLGTITFASDLKFWLYDPSAQIIRLDISSGTLQQLVIDAEAGGAHGRRIDMVGQESSFSARLGQGTY
jgi:hypothetical protein